MTALDDIRQVRGSYSFVDTDPLSREKPVVLLHGMLGDVGNWEKTTEALAAEGYRVIVPALPVYSIQKADANLTGLVRYLKGLFEALDLGPCTLCGNSMGGHLAVIFAALNPECVEQLVLSGASGITEVDLGTSIMRRKDRMYLRRRIEMTFYDPVHCTAELVDKVIRIINTREYAVRLISFARSVQRESILPLLAAITVPALILWGKNDQITPVSVAHTLGDRIENARLHIIDRCGHAPMMERPERFNEALLDFLSVSAPVESLDEN